MRKLYYIFLLIAIGITSCTNDSKPAKESEVLAYQGKKSTPEDFGVTSTQYRVAESDYYIKKHLKKAGVNEFAHQRHIVNVETQQVIRENQDILYSSAVVDFSEGATITVPAYEAYSIVQVIDMQNYSIATIYAGESKTFTKDDLSFGDYVYLNVRTQPTSNDAQGIAAANAQQDKIVIDAKSAKPYQSPSDLIAHEKMVEVRTALIKEVAKGAITDFTTCMGKADEVDYQNHLYACAYGWGGLPISDAGYLTIPNATNGRYPSSFTFTAPPIDKSKGGFWSVTTYSKKGWIANDKAAISNLEAVANEDGTYTINFNNPEAKNNIITSQEFAVLLRLYAPSDVNEAGKYLANGKANYKVDPSFDVNNPEEWPVNFADYGYTPEQYAKDETRTFFANFIKRSGLGNFFHFKTLAKMEDHWVVSPNNDVLYSVAIVNASKGFKLTVPEAKGDRIMSVQILDEDHFTPKHFYGAGEYDFPAGTFNTDFVVVGIRVEVNGTNPKDVEYVANEVQPLMKIESNSNDVNIAKTNVEGMKKLRAALMPYYEALPNSFGGMTKNREEVKDLWFRMICTAGAWGLSEDEHAMYAIYAPGLPADKCYTATYQVPPNDAFWSITMYDKEKYLVSNEANILNKNNTVMNDDGTFTVYFGSKEKLGDIPNRLDITDGWNFLMRAYRPDVEGFKAYKMPEVKEYKVN